MPTLKVFGSNDGYISHALAYATNSWNTVITAETGSAIDTALMYCQSRKNTSSGQWSCMRGFLTFNLSQLPANITITSAKVYIKTRIVAAPQAKTYNITGSTYTAIQTADYDLVGSSVYCDTPKDGSSLIEGNYMEFVLNSTGLSAITSGDFKISLREACDYNGTPDPADSSATQNAYLDLYLSSSQSNETRPFIVVDYTYNYTPSASTPAIVLNEKTTIDTPASGDATIYNKSNSLYLKKSDGTESAVSFVSAGYKYLTKATSQSITTTECDRSFIVNLGGKFGTSCGYFNGVNQCLTILDHDDFNLGNGNFTIDFWLHRTKGNERIWLMAQCNSSANNYANWIEFNADNTIEHQDVTLGIFASTGTVPINEWVHIALVRNGTTATWYINGVASGTKDWGATSTYNASNLFAIGRLGEYTSGTFYQGYIDEFRFSKGIARWTTDFTPPTSAYTSDSDTKLLLHMDNYLSETFIDSGNTVHTITNVNNTKQLTGVPQIEYTLPTPAAGYNLVISNLSADYLLKISTSQGAEFLVGSGQKVNSAFLNSYVSAELIGINSTTWAIKVDGNRPLNIGTIDEIVVGGAQAFIKNSNGEYWHWGRNIWGQLGIYQSTNNITPAKFSICNITFCQIRICSNYTLGLDKDGIVWSWGYNASAMLGDNTIINKCTPVRVCGTTTFCQVASGNDHSIAIDKDGMAWAWGYNNDGRVGDNTVANKCTPVRVCGTTTFCQVAGGTETTYALDKDNNLWSWGGNTYGQVGDNTAVSKRTPVRVCGSTTFCKISMGNAITVAIDKDGMAWAWGYNNYGQLGINSVTSKCTPVRVCGDTTFCQISAGHSHVFAIDKDGMAWAWGYNLNGQLGDNSTTSRRTPVRVCGDTTFCQIGGSIVGGWGMGIDKNNEIWVWGDNGWIQLTYLPFKSIVSRCTPINVTKNFY